MMEFASYRTALFAGAAISAFVAPAAAVAQPMAFDIAAQDLNGALQQFALKANREILYAPALVANRRTPGLVGRYTPEEALRRLLQGSDLGYRQTAPNVFILERDGMPRLTRAAFLTQETPVSAPASPAPAAPVTASVEAGSSLLTGAFYDNATGTPLAGARVTLQGTDLSAVTDERGIYRFVGIAPGTYTVVLEYLGDPTQTRTATVGAGTTSLDFVRGTADASDIVVVGYASATQRALNQQRTALNNSTVVSEDLLGGFPAETVSEAMRRVPGVAFGRDDQTGEGSRITVRGFTSEAINVQVNGLDLQGTNFERTVDLSGYLAENISTITIHKSLLPSHESTGSGGLVEIETRSGLDYGDFHFSGSIEGERALEKGYGREFQANGTLGAKITPNLGIAGTISYRDTNRTNFDVGVLDSLPAVLPAGYTSLLNVPASQQFPFDEEIDGRLIQTGNYGERTRDETNIAASVNVAWDIGNHTRLRLDAQHNKRDVLTYGTRTAVSFLTLGVDMPIPELGGEVRRRFVLNSFRPSVIPTSNDRQITSNTLSLRGDTDVDKWKFRYKVGYSGAKERSRNTAMTLLGSTSTNLTQIIDPANIQVALDDDAARTPRVIDGGFYILPNGVPVPAFTPLGFDLLNSPSTYSIVSATRSLTNSPTDALLGEASARREFGGILDYIEVGFKFDRSERKAADELFATTSVGSLRSYETFAPIAGRPTLLSDISPGLLGFGNFGEVGLGFLPPYLSAAGNEAIFTALEGLTVDDPSTPFNEARFNFTDVGARDPINDVGALVPTSSVERKLAGYIETHLELGKFDLVGGVRIEQTKRVGTNLSTPSVTLPTGIAEPRATFVQAGLVDFVNLEATDTFVSPSFLLNYRPATNIVARLGYFRSTVNPSLQLLRRSNQIFINLRPTVNNVILAEGNPDLKPTSTENWDFDVAYYFRDTPGLIRAGLFYKKTSNNFTNVFIQDQSSDEVRQRVLERFGALATSRPELVAFDEDTNFLIRRPENGEGGTIWGFELELIRQFNFLPGFLSGFGVIGNLTYTTADFPTLVSGRTDDGTLTSFSLDRPLEDQASWVYNAALTYAKGGFEGRLIYTHQSMTVRNYEIHDLNDVVPSYSTLDLRLSYNFNGPAGGLYTLFLEGDDLLRGPREPDIRSGTASYQGRGDASFFFPDSFQFNGGRTFTLGARVRF